MSIAPATSVAAAYRRRRGRGSGRPLRSNAEAVELVSGQCITAPVCIVSGSAQTAVPVTPANIGSSRLADLADNFAYFRFVALEVTFLEAVGGSHGAVAYDPQPNPGTTPTTLAQLAEMDRLAISLVNNTQMQHLRLSRQEMRGAVQWLFTESTGTSIDTEEQGTLYFAAHAAGTAVASTGLPCVVRYVVEFKGRLPPAVSVERRARRLAGRSPRSRDVRPSHR